MARASASMPTAVSGPVLPVCCGERAGVLTVACESEDDPSSAMTDEQFLQAFESQTLPIERWTHRAHLRVAVIYLQRHPFDDALRRMRSGIQAYNSAKDVENSLTSGYHETITHAWLHIVWAMLRQYGASGTAGEFLDEHPELAERKILRLFYSRERIMSPEAKGAFLEPDLAPLPMVSSCDGRPQDA